MGKDGLVEEIKIIVPGNFKTYEPANDYDIVIEYETDDIDKTYKYHLNDKSADVEIKKYFENADAEFSNDKLNNCCSYKLYHNRAEITLKTEKYDSVFVRLFEIFKTKDGKYNESGEWI